MRTLRGLLSLVLLTVTACHTGPTKSFEIKENRAKNSRVPLEPETVLIDARPAFQFAVAHPNGAINLQWDEFNQRQAPFEGYLADDLFFNARRLARLGIGPEADILIVGGGASGGGEEGRLAWTFKMMGLTHVRFAGLDSLDWPWTKEEAPPREKVAIWKPTMDGSLQITKSELLSLLRKKDSALLVLDVRPSREYLKDSDIFAKLGLEAEVVNLPWTDFLDEKGLLNLEVRDRLHAIGVSSNRKIAVIDEKGIRSAGITLLLRDLGYQKAAHAAGGYREWRWPLPKR